MSEIDQFLQSDLLAYIDKMKELLFPDIWENVLLDCSKNEILILWFLYRNAEANMTQVAEYIHVPLNTSTGIVARMEKKGLVCRERSTEDKRVVNICFGEFGRLQFQNIMKEFLYYGGKVLAAFSSEEIALLGRFLQKLVEILQEEHEKEKSLSKVRRIKID